MHTSTIVITYITGATKTHKEGWDIENGFLILFSSTNSTGLYIPAHLITNFKDLEAVKG